MTVLLVLLLASPALAGAPELGDADDGPDDAPAAAVDVESYSAPVVADEGLTRSLHGMYALEYSSSDAEAQAFLKEHRDNPYSDLFIAGEIWWRASTEALRAEDDPDLARRFDAHSRAAVKKAKRLFKAAKPRVSAEAFFVAGMSLGLRGQWRLSNRQYFKAYLDGKKAIKYLKRCVEIDPAFHDAYLGLGIFDYQAAVLPGVLRLGALLLARGDRARGLARIREAIDQGQFANRQAASFLMTILQTQEKDYAGALVLARRLKADFPESLYMGGVEATLLAGAGDVPGSAAAWSAVYARLSSDPAVFRRKAWGVFCGGYGEACVSLERLAIVEDWATKALATSVPDVPAGWPSALYLARGLARDARRGIKEAREDYSAALADPNAAPLVRELAGSCIRQTCSSERIFSFRKP